MLFVVANLTTRYGGPPQAVKMYAAALAGLGVEVRTVSTTQDGRRRLRRPRGEPLTQPGGDQLYLYPPGVGRHRPWSPRFAAGIKRHVAWADVVHVSNLYLPHNLYVYLACRRMGKPYVVQPHGTLEAYQRRKRSQGKKLYDLVFGHRYLREAAACHFTADSERNAAADLLRAGQGFVVPIPVELPAADSTSRPPAVLFLGRVTAKKRLDVLLDAWPTVRSRLPAARLIVAGPVDPDQRALVRRMSSLEGAEYLGVVEGMSRAALLAWAALFVLPSESENFAIAAAEAMASGVPILVSDQVAVGAAAETRGAGQVLQGLDPGQWASAMIEWLGDEDRRRASGTAARSMAEVTWSSEVVGGELRTHLRLVQEHGKDPVVGSR